MTENTKSAPKPKMHIVEIFDRDNKLIAGYPVREVGSKQAKARVLEERVTVRRASEDEIGDIALQGTTVLGIARKGTKVDGSADDEGQGSLVD
jgi:hypothetical protein